MGDFCLNDTILGSILWESFNYPDRPPQAKVWYDSKPYWRGGPWDGGRFIASDKFQVLKGLKLPDRYHYFPDKNPDECQNWCMGNCSCTAYAFVTTIYCMAWTEDLIDIQQFAFGGENLYLRLSYAEIDVEIVSRDTLQEDVHESFELPIYEFKPIIAATDNFSYRNKLCEGGFDPFYKGILDHGQQVAVKRLSGDSGQGIEEVKNEILLISKLQHRNLVKLLDPKKRSQLVWAIRFNIIQAIGRGLIYVHHDSCLRIIHRDLKCGNLLLDEKMNPKISDFGLARNFQMTQELANTRRIVGT
ncbi:G-type lectin S-receptor-like serine/threonine-protein kinase [Tanacetum coccineum]